MLVTTQYFISFDVVSDPSFSVLSEKSVHTSIIAFFMVHQMRIYTLHIKLIVQCLAQ